MNTRDADLLNSGKPVLPVRSGAEIRPKTLTTPDRKSGACSSPQPKTGRGAGQSPAGGAAALVSCLDELQHIRNRQKPPKYLTDENGLGRRLSCGSLTLRGLSLDGKATKYLRLHCKCWACPYCGPRKARRYQKAIANRAAQLGLQRFLTLTLDQTKIQGSSFEHLRVAFNRLRARLHKRYGQAASYIAVVELQKNGTPHLHVMLDRYIEQAWVKHVWEEIGGGFMVDIRYVDVHRAARYVSKYMTKELLLSAPHGTRRITCSRSIKLLEKPPKTHNWDMLKSPISELLRRLMPIASLIKPDSEGFLLEFTVQAG